MGIRKTILETLALWSKLWQHVRSRNNNGALFRAAEMGGFMSSYFTRSLRNNLGHFVAVAALFTILGGVSFAQVSVNDPANHAWQAGAIHHAQEMRRYVDLDRGEQPTPPIIPRFGEHFDPSGRIATFQPSGPTPTAQNAFFGNLGTNGRTCFSCHQPQDGWSISAASVQTRFSRAMEPIPYFVWLMEPRAQTTTFRASMQNSNLIGCY